MPTDFTPCPAQPADRAPLFAGEALLDVEKLERAGRVSRADKARFYAMARGTTTRLGASMLRWQ